MHGEELEEIVFQLDYYIRVGFFQTSPSLTTLEGGSCTKNMASTGAVVTVLCTPHDGCV